MKPFKVQGVSVHTVQKIHIRFSSWGWANYYLEDLLPGAGSLVIHSDWGCWGYTWGGMGSETIREFLLTANNDYIIHKLLVREDCREFDADATIKEWKKDILRDRWAGDMTKERARELWDALEDYDREGITDGTLFLAWLPSEVSNWIPDAWDELVYRPSDEYVILDEVVLPALKEVLKDK